jgi:hypothetical protein
LTHLQQKRLFAVTSLCPLAEKVSFSVYFYDKMIVTSRQKLLFSGAFSSCLVRAVMPACTPCISHCCIGVHPAIRVHIATRAIQAGICYIIASATCKALQALSFFCDNGATLLLLPVRGYLAGFLRLPVVVGFV